MKTAILSSLSDQIWDIYLVFDNRYSALIDFLPYHLDHISLELKIRGLCVSALLLHSLCIFVASQLNSSFLRSFYLSLD